MMLTIPRDFKSYICFRKLTRAIGKDAAALLFINLWIELGYQIDVHGGSGVFARRESEIFCTSLSADPEVCKTHFKALVDSEVLVPSGEDWVCPIFAMNNRSLDANFVPHTTKGRLIQTFNSRLRKMEKAATPFMSSIPEECWILGGGKISADEMRRSVMLIKTVDGILRVPDRPAEKYTPALIQAALQITRDYTEAKLHVILKTMFIKRGAAALTRSTEFYLHNFETVVVKIMPDEGFIEWNKKRTE